MTDALNRRIALVEREIFETKYDLICKEDLLAELKAKQKGTYKVELVEQER